MINRSFEHPMIVFPNWAIRFFQIIHRMFRHVLINAQLVPSTYIICHMPTINFKCISRNGFSVIAAIQHVCTCLNIHVAQSLWVLLHITLHYAENIVAHYMRLTINCTSMWSHLLQYLENWMSGISGRVKLRKHVGVWKVTRSRTCQSADNKDRSEHVNCG